jgi:trans-2,3-dihydro-3-hydroxyanthranilate isomerase
MGEDPATGSAAAPLCAYLARRAGIERLEIAQGLEMGRPSRLSCRLEGERVRVSGGAAVVFEGTVSL